MFFDPKKVEKVQSNYDALPKGWYRVMIASSEGKATKAGTGRYINMALDVVDGQYTGRKVWQIFNIQNPSEMAQKIGQSDLKRLLEALGTSQALQREDDLHRIVRDRVLLVKLGQKKDGQSGEMRNNVTDYRPDSDEPMSEQASSQGVGGSAMDDIPFSPREF